MLTLPGLESVATLLAIGAHSDDIEIGCAGTIRKLIAARPGLSVHWVVLSASGARKAEAEAAVARLTNGAGSVVIEVAGFRERYLPYQPDVKEFFDALAGRVSPHLVLTHHRGDLHQDHRVAAELTENTFRDQLILGYEVPKYDGDLTSPNVFVHLSKEEAAAKAALLLECFPSQRPRSWFSEQTFLGLAALRGGESRAPDGYAEGFHCRKLVIG